MVSPEMNRSIQQIRQTIKAVVLKCLLIPSAVVKYTITDAMQ